MSFFVRVMLSPVLQIYWLIGYIRRFCYRWKLIPQKNLGLPVISVGNIQFGGTGKTPFCIALAKMLQSQGKRPAILARGYRSGLAVDEGAVFLNGERVYTSTNREKLYADEALQQASLLEDVPVVIGAKRAKVWKIVKKQTRLLNEIDCIILDDGFQHLQVKRDFDIVLVDAKRLNELRRIPYWQVMREPMTRLKDADQVFITKALLQNPIKGVETTPLIQKFDMHSASQESVDTIPGKGLFVSCVAFPDDILDELRKLKVRIAYSKCGQDHQKIFIEDLMPYQSKVNFVVTTYKDYYRDPQIFANLSLPLYFIDYHFELPSSCLENLRKRSIV